MTDLHKAISKGDISNIESIANDRNVNSTKYDFWGKPISPLHLAILDLGEIGEMTARPKIVRILLKKGADPNIECDDWRQPIEIAVRNEEDWLVDLLIENGADCTITTSDRYTLLHQQPGNRLDLYHIGINKVFQGNGFSFWGF